MFDQYIILFAVWYNLKNRQLFATILQDPSIKDRPSSDYIGKLFPPIFALNTFDVLNFTGLDIDNSEHSRQQPFSLGRPLWAALFEAKVSLDGILNLAKDKIPQAPSLSLLSYCVSFWITDQAMCEKYAAEHLRYILSIKQERTFVQALQPTKSILARAALRLFLDKPRLLDSLRAFHTACSRATIDVGGVGEMVAAMVILFSISTTQVSNGQSLLFETYSKLARLSDTNTLSE